MKTEYIGKFSLYAYEGEIAKDNDGNILNKELWAKEDLPNIIVTSGKNGILDRIFGLSAVAAFNNVGVGTDSTVAGVGQTQLNPTVAGSVLIQTADAGTARASNVVTIQSTFGTGVANFNWQELGIFNGNTMVLL